MRDLGAALGLSFQQIQHYETGAQRVSVGRLAQIATELDQPVAAFFDPPAVARRRAALRAISDYFQQSADQVQIAEQSR